MVVFGGVRLAADRAVRQGSKGRQDIKNEINATAPETEGFWLQARKVHAARKQSLRRAKIYDRRPSPPEDAEAKDLYPTLPDLSRSRVVTRRSWSRNGMVRSNSTGWALDLDLKLPSPDEIAFHRSWRRVSEFSVTRHRSVKIMILGDDPLSL
jgi:hypothetical protein